MSPGGGNAFLPSMDDWLGAMADALGMDPQTRRIWLERARALSPAEGAAMEKFMDAVLSPRPPMTDRRLQPGDPDDPIRVWSDKLWIQRQLAEMALTDETIRRQGSSRGSLITEFVEVHRDIRRRPPVSLEAFRSEVVELVRRLREPGRYTAYVFFLMERGGAMKVGDQLGSLECVEDPGEDDMRFSDVPGLLKFLDVGGSPGWEVPRTELVWARVQLSCPRPSAVERQLHVELELPFAILTLCTGDFFDNENPFFVLVDSDGARVGGRVPPAWRDAGPSLCHDEDKWLRFRALAARPNRTELEERILRSVGIWFLSHKTHVLPLRFIAIISALEALVLTKADQNSLGKRLAEKVSLFAQIDVTSPRDGLFWEVKAAYKERGDLLHQGLWPNVDVERIDSIYHHTIERLLLMIAAHETVDDAFRRRKKDLG